MRTVTLTLPELMFVVGTRAMLAAGVALLALTKLSEQQRRAIGTTLVAIGVVTTIPAAIAVMRKRELAPVAPIRAAQSL
jgi:uncharacterized protein YjeT (DUF2065 family)